MATEKEIELFADYVVNHKCMPDLYSKLKMQVFEKFISADDDGRNKAGDLMFAINMLASEIESIASASKFDEVDNEEKEFEAFADEEIIKDK